MTEFIPHESQFPSIRNIVASLRRQGNIRVIFLWIYGSYQRNVFSEVNKQNLTGRIWILSDVSVTSRTFLHSNFFTINESIGFQPHRFYDAGFKGHMIELLINETSKDNITEWLSEAKVLARTCSAYRPTDVRYSTNNSKLCTEAVVQDMYGSYIPYVIDAVYSFAHALEIGLTEDSNNNENQFYDMRRLLSRVHFAGLSGNVKFDEFGDRQSAVYDIVKFQQVHVTGGKRQLQQAIVGKWEGYGQNSKKLRFYDNMHWKSTNNTPPKSECAAQCPKGTRQSTTSPCCWQCVPCPRGTINIIPGSQNCI
ncbi:metabotropic glutamate receptor 4-like [Oculina patagonica]